jgi:hypothetical protein
VFRRRVHLGRLCDSGGSCLLSLGHQQGETAGTAHLISRTQASEARGGSLAPRLLKGAASSPLLKEGRGARAPSPRPLPRGGIPTTPERGAGGARGLLAWATPERRAGAGRAGARSVRPCDRRGLVGSWMNLGGPHALRSRPGLLHYCSHLPPTGGLLGQKKKSSWDLAGGTSLVPRPARVRARVGAWCGGMGGALKELGLPVVRRTGARHGGPRSGVFRRPHVGS